MNRRRNKAAAPDGDRRPDVNRAGPFEFAVAVEAIEGGKFCRCKRDGLYQKCAQEETFGRRPLGIDAREPFLASTHLDRLR